MSNATISTVELAIPATLTKDQQLELVNALLECPYMSEREKRDAVVRSLPNGIKNNAMRNNNPKLDVAAIVETALYYEGLRVLIERLNGYEDNSQPFQSVCELLKQIANYSADSKRAGQSVEKGLNALADLMETPAVRDAVQAYDGAFQDVCKRMETLDACKTLHDKFQELDDSFRNLVVAKDFVGEEPEPCSAKAWGRVQTSRPVFELRLQEVLNCISNAPHVYEELVSTALLEVGRDQLKAAIDKKDVELLTIATDHFGAVLARDPSRLNQCLIDAAKKLGMSELVESLKKIRDILAELGLQGENAERFEQFKRAIEALYTLREQLKQLIASHNFLQRVTDQLYPIDAQEFQNTREFELRCWQIQRMELQKLNGLFSADWVREIRVVVTEVEGCLSTYRDLQKTWDGLLRYRALVNHTFNRIDRELMKFCKESLQKISHPLDRLRGERNHG
jgi:hypothetical protein